MNKIYLYAFIENVITIISSCIIVATIAIYKEGSLHCLWGLLMLFNINTYKSKKVLNNNTK